MRRPSMELKRRTLLVSAAGLAVLGATPVAAPSIATSRPEGVPPGKPGEFDFLAGRWKIRNRMLKQGAWDEFPGEATCWTILGGVGSVEELRIPARDFSGMGLRLLDREKKVWSDFWVNAKSGVLAPPGMPGGFRDGVGTFVVDDTDEKDRPITVVSPCGACRELIWDYDRNARVIVPGDSGPIAVGIGELLPNKYSREKGN